ncbi:DUF4432 family protein [Cohnella rhizosphaerae]|uniref:DUF4432 family protein n=1 Tax=Cohnella rhizosphaerae TaxID=1457232 RepID=A0A9X4QSP2_9BACL|nr:DUF4432 family protein [Cohnella rhizosphaerae]MDG0809519.1 DUF4432 family protein [Cohnella rhizosphaerae]
MVMEARATRIHGSAVVTLANDRLSVTIVPGKGADIVSLIHLASGTELLWRSPAGLDALSAPNAAGSVRYVGGWIEAFPNAWSGCTHRGRALSGYGDVWQLPWEYRIERIGAGDDAGAVEEIRAVCAVQSRELPLRLIRTVSLRSGCSVVRIDETVLNTGDETVDFTWGHHPNLGRPFLDESCVIDLPPCEIWRDGRKTGAWPYLQGPEGPEDLRLVPPYGTSRENRQILLRRLAASEATVRNTASGLSFRLSWDGATFPDLLLWRAFDIGPSETFGDGQIVCLFPKRSHSNVAEAAAAGEALTLAPGETKSVWIEAGVMREQVCLGSEPIHKID